ncbi:hypothetical protein M5689_003080 [Euphorbia peplus]|nr:hypothetical protein M5689_003080 [Euphorbia peplus]
MAITCHFIDDSWTLCSHLLRFIYVPSHHTKDELEQYLLEVLTKWNVETKILTITADNCTTNDGMISILAEKLSDDLLLEGDYLHMRCCAHILNLVVKDELSILDSAIVRIRESVSFWTSTPQRYEKFQDMAK